MQFKYPAVETTALTEREKAILFITKGNPDGYIESMQYSINEDGSRTCITKFQDSDCYVDWSAEMTLAFGRKVIDDGVYWEPIVTKEIKIKANKRSEWMEGLLFAEAAVKDLPQILNMREAVTLNVGNLVEWKAGVDDYCAFIGRIYLRYII